MSKYKNKKITVDGIKYDSKKEYERYVELRTLEQAGEITDLRFQVPYELIPTQYETVERYSSKTGKRLKDKQRVVERGVTYIADFVYKDRFGNEIVEDAKGYKKGEAYSLFTIKRKLMLYFKNIKVHEV